MEGPGLPTGSYGVVPPLPTPLLRNLAFPYLSLYVSLPQARSHPDRRPASPRPGGHAPAPSSAFCAESFRASRSHRPADWKGAGGGGVNLPLASARSTRGCGLVVPQSMALVEAVRAPRKAHTKSRPEVRGEGGDRLRVRLLRSSSGLLPPPAGCGGSGELRGAGRSLRGWYTPEGGVFVSPLSRVRAYS